MKQLTEMSDEELHDDSANVNMTIKGHICRLISGVAATKSTLNNLPAPTEKDVHRAASQDKLASCSTVPDCISYKVDAVG